MYMRVCVCTWCEEQRCGALLDRLEHEVIGVDAFELDRRCPLVRALPHKHVANEAVHLCALVHARLVSGGRLVAAAAAAAAVVVECQMREVGEE